MVGVPRSVDRDRILPRRRGDSIDVVRSDAWRAAYVLEHRRSGARTAVPIDLGGSGFGAVVSKSIVAFTVIKFIGVAYLLYLAVRQWRASGHDLREQMDGSPTREAYHCLPADFWSTPPTRRRCCSTSPCCRSSWCPMRRCRRSTWSSGLTFITVDVLVMSVYATLSTRILKLLGARQQRHAQPILLQLVRDCRGGARAGAPGLRRLTPGSARAIHPFNLQGTRLVLVRSHATFVQCLLTPGRERCHSR